VKQAARAIIISLCFVVAMSCAHAQANATPWRSPGSHLGEEITGPDGGKLMWVPAGEFQMGACPGDIDYAIGRLGQGRPAAESSSGPVHRVRISRGFWIGKHEVTNTLYQAYCKAGNVQSYDPKLQGPEHPARFVNWMDANAYCTHFGLVLPTEAQWEYAARGPENRWFPWGNDWDSTRCAYVNRRGPAGETWPVGSFPTGASWCGALDLAGNLDEWCQDWYDRLYYQHSPKDDPTGPTSGEDRVMRGGDAGDAPWACRGAQRGSLFPEQRRGSVGFRVCITP
jgi:formylglycine-generating enzyme required for sulfatase activity